MTSPLWGKYCDGGHYCSNPKECCTLGCCYTIPNEGLFGLWFLGHWYFWALVTAALIAVLCACSLWRRCWYAVRCLCMGARNEHSSELGSVSSYYAPPQYSRCNSFQRAPPPPYNEVTTKPDLYPLVISYNGDTGTKRNDSTSYLMVQYFRNYILRPSGSISATSTIDSLSSSFICSAANEANTIIPPPYSSTGSLEGFNVPDNTTTSVNGSPLIHSNAYDQRVHSSTPNNIAECKLNLASVETTIINKPKRSANPGPAFVHNKSTSFINNMPNGRNEIETKTCDFCCQTTKKPKSKVSTENSVESEGDDHNFSELLNLSVCASSAILGTSRHFADHHQYSVANSVTASDVSSLANLGTPDSPPRATSPTVEIRELLDKIQQLPQQRSPTPKPAPFSAKTKSKTFYMPLTQTGVNYSYSKKGWLSRSAPTTPCGNFVGLFPTQIRAGAVRSLLGSSVKMDDAHLLLNNLEDQHTEASGDEHL